MMLKALLKVRLAAFGAYFTGASRSRRRQSKVQKIGMLAVMLYALAAFGMLFYTSFSAIAGIYAHEGFGWLYFAMYAIMAFALMVFGSVFTAKAQLYEAKDNELLLSMPIAPRAILASRMASLWLLNLIFGLVVAVPAALAWAQAAALPVLGWVSMVLLLPALDFFSLAVTSLLAWGLSLLASRLRRKSLVTVIGSVVFLGAYFAVVFRMNGYIEQLAQNGAAIAESLAGAKLLVWLGRAMAQGSALALLWSLLALLLLAAPARAAEENTVVIGCDVYAPYTYKDGTGDFIGIDVQLAHEAFGRLGYDVEFREIAWENKDKALASGEVDCIWSCFTMNGREDAYTWAGPYLYSRQVALVRADSDYTELSQLNGGRAAVQASTTAENALVKRESAVAPELAQVLCFSTIGEAVSALRKGYVDMVVAHESVIQSVVHGSPEKYRVLDQALFANELGVAFEKGTHEALAARLQAVIDDMRGDGSAEAIVASYGLDAKKMLEGN